MDFPYQVVMFFDHEPEIGEPVYHGSKGWFPQLAIKRRFRADEPEAGMLQKVAAIAASTKPFKINFGEATKPEHMPVEVVPVTPNQDLLKLHQTLFNKLGQSKYPERESRNYFPHMTIFWRGERTVNASQFANSEQAVNSLFVLKDDASDSRVLAKFELTG